MLGADMSQRESAELRLPLANVPDETTAPSRQLVANIRHDSNGAACALDENGGECRDARHWQRSLLGQDYSPAELARVFEGATADAGGREHAPELLVRADAHAPYGEVQQLFESAARAGIFKVELAAARRANAGGR
jgi:biopolymer transport protein ExbD